MQEIKNINNRKVQLCIKGLFGATSSADNLCLVGTVFIGTEKISTQKFESLLQYHIEKKDLSVFLKTVNGFYCAVYWDEQTVYLISDRMRSRPIFFSTEQGEIIVSDDYYHLVRLLERREIDRESEEEFLMTGYVTGYQTLVCNVYQVESAQYVKISLPAGEVNRVNYWLFLPTDDTNQDFEGREAFDRIDKAFGASIDRLIAVAAGRQVAVPLSGGYDSRAIILYLKMKGYTNLITFTFGVKRSPEVDLSQRIAADLNIPWHFVEYTRGTWRNLKKSNEFKEYISFIGSGVSVANVQALPATKKLLEDGVIRQDAIVIPGHSGFVAGGNLTHKILAGVTNLESALSTIERCHYQLTRDKASKNLLKKVYAQIEKMEDEFKGYDYLQRVEAWECRERQSKFIVNSNRYYDFYKLDWWMPLLDIEFIDAWEKVSYRSRVNKNLWVQFIEEGVSKMTRRGVPYGRAVSSTSPAIRFAKRGLNYFYDMNGLLTLVPFRAWLLYRLHLTKSKGKLFSYLSAKYVAEIKYEIGAEQ